MQYEYNDTGKKGHPGIALLLAILGLLVTIFVGMFFGMMGVVPGVILAVAGIVIGIMSMRVSHGKGKGGLIIGIIALLFSGLVGSMTMFLGEMLKLPEVQEKAPILAAYSNQGWRGIGGLIMKMSSDGVDFDQLSKELEELGKVESAGQVQTTASEAAKSAGQVQTTASEAAKSAGQVQTAASEVAKS